MSVGAEVRIGDVVIGGEARNFAFLGNGDFKTKQGFGVFLSIGAADGETFKWPTWLPIQIKDIGIQWPDIQADPTNFSLTLSASIKEITGIPGLKFSGSVEGIKIDIGKLLAGEFPITDIASLGVSVEGDMFGGQIKATLIGGILKLSSAYRVIDPLDTTTPVEKRILFVGLEGGFTFAGMAGLTIRLALSELGPLTVQLGMSLPTGILLEPNTGLSMNDFFAGVEFFKTLPSIDQPQELRGPAFQLPVGQSPDEWLSTVKQQVANQALLLRDHPEMNGFTAAFTAPMTITGRAKIFTIYTSQQVFNGEVVIKFSTDGKILIIGKLNFANDNISVAGRLYADLSRVSQGDVTVLFLADVPEQVQLLTMYGRLKMGFRDATGNEVEFVVPNEPPLQPTANLSGPRNGDAVAVSELNGRGYIDVKFTPPAGYRLDEASITDAADDFVLNSTGDSVQLDRAQRPILVATDGDSRTYRFWVRSAGGSGVGFGELENGWVAINKATGQSQGKNLPAMELVGGEVGLTRRYIDVLLAPRAAATVDLSSVGPNDLVIRRTDGTVVALSAEAPTRLPGSNLFRFYVSGTFEVGQYTVEFAPGAWRDSVGASVESEGSFTVVAPKVTLASPFDNRQVLDIRVANADRDADGFLYVDVTYSPAPGSDLDYGSIFDAEAEFTFTGPLTGGSFTGAPVPIELVTDPDTGLPTARIVAGSWTAVTEEQKAALRNAGVTRFRYRFSVANAAYQPGTVTIAFAAGGWSDNRGNPGDTPSFEIVVAGPTANLVAPIAGGTIDINAINNRNWIDIAFPEAPVGYAIDYTSIKDLAPEIALAGEGLGSAKLDGSQAPVVLSEDSRTVRFWVNGVFGLTGDVTATFLAGSWALKNSTAAAATTLNPGDVLSSTFIVAFPPVPAGYALDLASITDADPELTLGGAGQGTAALHPTTAPALVDAAAGTVRYTITGAFAASGAVTATWLTGSWSITPTGGATLNLGNRAADNDRSYIDVQYLATRKVGDTIDEDSVDGDELSFTGAGGVTIASGDPIALGAGRYRYLLSGDFGVGAITVTFAGGSFGIAQSEGYENVEEDEAFTIVGPTTDLTGITGGAVVGVKSLNRRGYLDVAIVVPADRTLNLDSVTDLGPEFTIGGLFTGALVLDATQAPQLLRQTGNTYVFRYWTLGDYQVGDVELTWITVDDPDVEGDGFAFADGPNTVSGPFAPIDFTVNGIATPNLHYLDVTLTPTSGDTIDAAWATDATAELTLSNTGASGVAQVVGAAPTRLWTSDVYRFYVAGTFAAGQVDVTFAGGTVTSGGVGNLAETESFTIAALTAGLDYPPAGGIVAIEELNGRGYLDVVFTIPGWAAAIDAASVVDLEPEFTIGGLAAGETLELDAAQAPVFIRSNGADYTFRYFTTGTKRTGTVALTMLPGSVAALDEAGDSLPPGTSTAQVYDDLTDATNDLFIDVTFGAGTPPDVDSITDDADGAEFTIPGAVVTSPTEIAPGVWRYKITGAALGQQLTLTFVPGSWTVGNGQSTLVTLKDATPDLADGGYLDVRYDLLNGVALDLATIDGDELELGGTAAAGLTLSSDVAPTVMADGRTVRYYFTGRYTRGTVKVTFVADSWTDLDGNAGATSTHKLQVAQAPQPPDPADPPRVFFIDISGGMELRLAGAFDNQPIIEIRGKVTLEIGAVAGRPVQGPRQPVRQRHAEAHRRRQHRLGARPRSCSRRATGSPTSPSGASPRSRRTSTSSSSTASTSRAPRCCRSTRPTASSTRRSRSRASPAA